VLAAHGDAVADPKTHGVLRVLHRPLLLHSFPHSMSHSLPEPTRAAMPRWIALVRRRSCHSRARHGTKGRCRVCASEGACEGAAHVLGARGRSKNIAMVEGRTGYSTRQR
jgi:hypothetical protein